MLCSNPWVKENGEWKKAYVYDRDKLKDFIPFGCGQCLHCRINRAREWTFRIMAESKFHDSSIVCSLTYDDEHLPIDGSLVKDEITKYMKRLRRRVEPIKVKYYACGEYGNDPRMLDSGRVSDGWRPHYHIILFGLGAWLKTRKFPNKKIEEAPYNDAAVRAWQEKGFVYVDFFSKQAARYVAGYVTKGVDSDRREYIIKQGLRKEFSRMSKNPAIGNGIVGCVAPEVKKHGTYVVREANMDGRRWPVGRYLGSKFDDAIGVSDGEKEAYLWQHVGRLIDSGARTPAEYVASEDQARLKVEKRRKIFRKRL